MITKKVIDMINVRESTLNKNFKRQNNILTMTYWKKHFGLTLFNVRMIYAVEDNDS